MKKILTIALFLIPLLGFAQTTKPIDGFLGIKFGAPKEEVIAAVKAKGGILNQQGKDPDLISFSQISLGHRMSEILFVYLYNGKAYGAGYAFKPELEAQTISYYEELVNDINSIYGVAKSEKYFADPYKDGDGYETQAISLGKANYQTNWKSGSNHIEVFISSKLIIFMNYFDDNTKEIVDKAKKEKEKGDF